MYWDVPRQRGAGFTLQVLHVSLAHPILALLEARGRMHPTEMARALTPERSDATAVSRALSLLRAADLVARCEGGPGPGSHAVYELTAFGAGMAGSLEALGDWACARFGMADRSTATTRAIGLFAPRWTFALMAAAVNAGPAGIGPGRAQDQVNVMIASHPEGARRRLHPGTRHVALGLLEGAGLLCRRRVPSAVRPPARVVYVATGMGASLMDALWPVAEWALPWDGELSACAGMLTGWWDGR